MVVISLNNNLLFLEFGVSALSTGSSVFVFCQEYTFSAARAELICPFNGIATDLVVIFCSHYFTFSYSSFASGSGTVFLFSTYSFSICFMRSAFS